MIWLTTGLPVQLNDWQKLLIRQANKYFDGCRVDNPTVVLFNACILTYQPGVNSINILRTTFLYESELRSFL